MSTRRRRPRTSPGPTPAAPVGRKRKRPGPGRRAAAQARRKVDAPYACPLAAAMRRQIDEVAEAPVDVLELRPRARRFDGSGRRLARVHSVFRPGRGPGQGKVLPMLRLSGNWLRETGFPIGKRYSVEVEDGALVIRAL